MLNALVRGTVAYGLAQIVARGAQFAVLMALPAFLAPRDYGALQLILTLSILANFVIPLEVTQGLARHYTGAPSAERAGLAGSAWWFTVAGVAVALAAAQLFARPLGVALFGDPALVGAFRIGTLFIAAWILFYFVQNQFRWAFDLTGYVLVSLLFALGTAGLTLGLALATRPALDGALAGQALGAALAALFGIVRLRGELATPPRRDALAAMLRYSTPLVPAQIALFASLYLGRLVLNAEAGLTDVGLFTFASQIAGVVSLLMVGLQSALAPLVIAHHAEPGTPPLLARLFEGFVALAALLCLALGLFAPELVRAIGRPEYLPAAPLVMLLTAAALASQLYVFAPGFVIAKRTDRQLGVSLAGAVTSVAANLLLVPAYGIWGAAWASLLAALVFMAGWFLASERLYPVPVRWGRVAGFTAVAVAVATLPFAFAAPSVPARIGALLLIALAALLLKLVPAAPAAWRGGLPRAAG